MLVVKDKHSHFNRMMNIPTLLRESFVWQKYAISLPPEA